MKRLSCLALMWVMAAVFSGAWAQGPANGVFLVAQPSLTAPMFRRTVILITQRPDGGSLGVILNRPTDVAHALLFPKHRNLAALTQNVFLGGPVEPQALLFLVRTEQTPPGAIRILSNVYLTADVDWVDGAIGTMGDSARIGALRVYAGYAGWAPRQLRSEMERQGWYILPADSESIFASDDVGEALWETLVKRAVLQPTAAQK